MRRLPSILGAALVFAAVLVPNHAFDDIGSALFLNQASAQTIGSGPCGLNQVAFCDTFDQPAGTGNRSGQMNGTVWGVSRATGNNNAGQSMYDAWMPAQLQGCGGMISVQPPNDVVICNGRVREVTNDGGVVTTLAMYPKQPFDFAGRTGIVTFDVSNDTQGTHASWPEFWMSDQPVPAPFTHEASWIAAPRNGFGIRFGASVGPGKGYELAPACPNDANTRWTVDSAVIMRNFVADDSFDGGAVVVTPLDCVISSSGPDGGLNHVEVHVAQNQLDVYATDAGTTAPLHHIAVIKNANLTLSRGLIWLEDVHYNAGKFNTQRTHTYTWDNVGFDGPTLSRDLTFDVMDPLSPTGIGAVDLGWLSTPGAPGSRTISGVSNVANASAALLTFNFSAFGASPTTFKYVVNGHAHSLAWPYPDSLSSSWRTLALPVPLSDVAVGANSVSIAADQPLMIANVDLILAGAGGGGSIVTGQGGPTPVPTSTPAPLTATPIATRTPTAGSTATLLPAADFKIVEQANPAMVARGSQVTLSATVTAAVSTSVLVDVEVDTAAGVKVFQKNTDNQAFTVGQSRTYSGSWIVPANAVPGTYLVKIGVFSPDWGTLYTWTYANLVVQ